MCADFSAGGGYVSGAATEFNDVVSLTSTWCPCFDLIRDTPMFAASSDKTVEGHFISHKVF